MTLATKRAKELQRLIKLWTRESAKLSPEELEAAMVKQIQQEMKKESRSGSRKDVLR